jgi:hypothetical protein
MGTRLGESSRRGAASDRLGKEAHVKEGLRRNATTIAIAAVTALVLGGGSAYAVVVNANKLNGYTANQLNRVAVSQKNNNSVIGDGNTHIIRQVRIMAPKNGFLVMTASTDGFLTSGTTGSADCWLSLGGHEISSTDRTEDYDSTVRASESDCVTNTAWPVKAGRHTVAFMGDPETGVIFDESALVVQFVPFNGSGGVPHAIPPFVQTNRGN